MMTSEQPQMSLEEARAVLWLRNNHRPMGELFDEGYLDTMRLTWAIERAYDPRVKESAAVLLKTLEAPAAPPQPVEEAVAATLPPIPAGLTVAEARAVLWPFKPFKGQPMGDLSDTRQLGLKDLVYAVENAWDRRVQQAAVVLAALRLEQTVQEPLSPAGPLKVVAVGESYSENQQLLWTQVQGFLLGAFSVLWVFLLIRSIRDLATPRPALEGLGAPLAFLLLGAVILIGLGVGRLFSYLLDLAFKRTDTEIDNARKGREGEAQALEIMRQNLDGNWTFFCNVTLPGKNKGDIDGVLVGPPGVWALEVKNFTGPHRNFGEHWERTSGKKALLLKKSPSRQAKENARRLADFFRADGLRQWVEPVVVWANRESPLTVEQPTVPVWTLDRLPEELGNLWRGTTMEAEARSRIEEKLTALCQSKARKHTED